MSFLRKYKLTILIGTVILLLVLTSGCLFVTPDYGSYTVSYIKVTPYSATMELGHSKKFKILAYDAEDNLIPVDPSKVDWGATYQCPGCGKVWKFSPESGSITTTFTPEKAGKYYVWGHYKGESNKSDSSRVDVE